MSAETAAFVAALATAYRNKRESDPIAALAVADEMIAQIDRVTRPPPHAPLSREAELESFVPLDLAAALQGVSRDTLEREDARRVARGEPSQIIDLSARRKGMRLKHALRLA
jgi:hypothetical protein